MASYTMQLRTIIEQASQYQTGLSNKEKIEIGRKALFDFDYPIFDVAYKNILETNFIRHFYMREIGFETEGLFKFQLESWLLLHMTYFNKMFESELISFDPLINSELDLSHTRSGNKTQNDVNDGTKNKVDKEISNLIESQTSATTGSENATGSSDTTASETSSDRTVSDDVTSSDVIASGTSTNDRTTNDESNKSGTGSKTDDNFERKLSSNTPDSRLAITTNDGQGVIEYASSIDEENENNVEKTTNASNETKTGSVGDEGTTSSNVATDETRNNVSTSNGSRSVTSGTDTVDDSTSTSNTNANKTGDSIVDSTGDVITKDTLVSNINDLEDFVQHRIGKVGIQTYSEMLMLYRKSFVRIEKTMFEEMQELFMLVY